MSNEQYGKQENGAEQYKGAPMAAALPEDATPVPSPCIGVCRMVPASGLCEGCLRTIDEIRTWRAADDASKRAVWRLIRAREADIRFDEPAR